MLEKISLSLGVNWIPKLYKKLKSIQKKRTDELNELNDIMIGDPQHLAKFYIEPDCQIINPVECQKDESSIKRETIYDRILAFLKDQSVDRPGCTQMFILSGIGMGKTSLLVMLRLLQITAHFPKKPFFVLKVMGKTTVDEIKNINDKRNTVLLLDSLEENKRAYGDIKKWIKEILYETRHFRKVIITCRTQFFPKYEKGAYKVSSEVNIDGFLCTVLFLSPFNEIQVDSYLKKRFPWRKNLLSRRKKIQTAKNLIAQMGALKFRPMLLAEIDRLMYSPHLCAPFSEYNIYMALVESWLSREEANFEVQYKTLLKICGELALKLSKEKSYSISEKDLKFFLAEITETVKVENIKGRSLLNRGADGNYRFAHYGIQEFLVVKYFIENQGEVVKKRVTMTQFMARLLITASMFKNCQKFFEIESNIFKDLHLQNQSFDYTMLQTGDLQTTNLKGAILRNWDLTGRNLEAADLQVAILEGANLENSNLVGANLLGADLRQASLKGGNLEKAEFNYANLSNSNLSMCRFNDTDLRSAILNFSDFSGAKINNTLFKEGKACLAKFQGAVILNTGFNGSDMQESNFSDAKVENCDISNAILDKADMSEGFFTDVQFDGTFFNDANLQGAVFKNCHCNGGTFRRTDFRFSQIDSGDYSESIFREINVENANFKSTLFQGVSFYDCKLQGVNFMDDDFSGGLFSNVVFIDSEVQGTLFNDGIFEKVSFKEINLKCCQFRGANFEEVVFCKANLHSADFQSAVFNNVDFEKADMANVNLSFADLTNARNLTIQMLLSAGSLYEIKGISPKVINKIMDIKPWLFDELN